MMVVSMFFVFVVVAGLYLVASCVRFTLQITGVFTGADCDEEPLAAPLRSSTSCDRNTSHPPATRTSRLRAAVSHQIDVGRCLRRLDFADVGAGPAPWLRAFTALGEAAHWTFLIVRENPGAVLGISIAGFFCRWIWW